MAGEVEEDDLLLARLTALLGLADGGSDGVCALGCGDNALSACEEHACLEGLELWYVDAVHQSVLDELRDDHARTVVAQTAGVDVGGLEVVAQGVHGQQWRVAGLVAEVVAELSSGELGAAVGLCGDELGLLAVEQVVAHEGEGDASEVGASSEASDDDIGILAGHLHLLLGLKADDGLVQPHVVEHGAEGILTVGRGGGQLYGLGDGGAERSAVGGVLGEDVLAGAGGHRGRAFYHGAEGAHDGGAVGLLLHSDLHLIYGAVEAVDLGSIREGCAPLSGTGLGGHVGGALLLGVVALGQGGVDLMRTQGVGGLVLEIDVCGGAECLFEGVGAHQGCGAVVLVLVEHVLGNVYPAVLGVELLHAAFAWEDVCQVIDAQGLLGSRVDGRHGLVGHVGLDVVPLCRNLTLLEDEFFLFSHNNISFGLVISGAKVRNNYEL